MSQKDLYLQHHGVKGMHWGIRRYQNYDGTLKKEGKERYINGAKTGYGKNTRAGRWHDMSIEGEWKKQKSLAKKDPKHKKSSEYLKAKKNHTKNVTSRLMVGINARGKYYRNRDAGKSKAESALRTAGYVTAVSAAGTGAVALGAALVTKSPALIFTLKKRSVARKVAKAAVPRTVKATVRDVV